MKATQRFSLMVAAGAFVLAGCTSFEQRPLALQVRPGEIHERVELTGEPSDDATGQPILIRLASIEDARRGGGDLGETSDFRYITEDVVGWVREGLVVSSTPQIQFLTEADVPASYMMEVKLMQCYLKHQLTNKSSIVVLSCVLSDAQGQPFQRIIARGTNSGMNWAGGDGEMAASLNRALELALQDLHAKLQEVI